MVRLKCLCYPYFYFIDGIPLDLKDMLLLELLKWFKLRFFKWMDSPRCDICGGTTRSIGMVEPTAEERRWEAGRVEGYACTSCNRNVRFPRYVARQQTNCCEYTVADDKTAHMQCCSAVAKYPLLYRGIVIFDFTISVTLCN